MSSPALQILRLPAFGPLLAGNSMAVVGQMMLGTALGWDLYEQTGSPLVLGYVGLVQFIPVLLFALPAGQVADRFNRKGIMLACVLLTMGCALGLAALAAGHGPLWGYLACIFGVGVAQAFMGPARSALVPALVPQELLGQALALSSSVFQFGFLFGPLAAGALIALTHQAMPVYLVDAAATLVFAVLLARVPVPPQVRPQGAASWADVLVGLRFVFSRELMLAAITLDMFAVLLGGAVALLPVFARDVLHVGPVGLGILTAAQPLGALVMGVAMAHRPPVRRNGPVLLFAVTGFGLATLGFGLSHWAWLSWLMLFLVGATDMVSMVIRNQLTTLLTPDAMRGRVSAVHLVFVGTSNELGGFESGLTAAWWGAARSVIYGGLGTLAVVGLVASRSRALRELRELVPAESTAGVA